MPPTSSFNPILCGHLSPFHWCQLCTWIPNFQTWPLIKPFNPDHPLPCLDYKQSSHSSIFNNHLSNLKHHTYAQILSSFFIIFMLFIQPLLDQICMLRLLYLSFQFNHRLNIVCQDSIHTNLVILSFSLLHFQHHTQLTTHLILNLAKASLVLIFAIPKPFCSVI